MRFLVSVVFLIVNIHILVAEDKLKSCPPGESISAACLAWQQEAIERGYAVVRECLCMPDIKIPKKKSSEKDKQSMGNCPGGWVRDRGLYCGYTDLNWKSKDTPPHPSCKKDNKYLWLCPAELYADNPNREEKKKPYMPMYPEMPIFEDSFDGCTKTFREVVECPEGSYYFSEKSKRKGPNNSLKRDGERKDFEPDPELRKLQLIQEPNSIGQ